MNKAVIYANPPTIETEVVQLPVPEPGFGQVLVRLSYSGVCHTDYGFCTNAFSTLPAPTPKGQVGGHEGIGNVVKQGPGVLSPAVGDLVGVKFAASACLNCDNCLVGGETSCPNGTVSGYFTPGTFQQYCLGQASYVTPIPDNLDPAGAAALMCGGVTVYTALKRAKVQHGQWVVVSGAGGGLGHLAIQYAIAMGAEVLAIDHGSKEQFCIELGAKAFLDYTQFSTTESLVAQVQKTTIVGANIVLACFSSNNAYAQAVSFLGFRGLLVCLGVPEGPPVPIGGAIVGDMIAKELTIFAIKSGNRLDAKECLQLAADKGIKTSYTLRPMDDLTQIFEEMKHGEITGRAILDLR